MKNQNIVIFLRGINVSGQKKIKMAELRSYMEEAGFLEVKTYIQSGNILVAKNGKKPKEIKAEIEQLLKEKYNSYIECFLLNIEKLKDILKNIPFEVDVENLLSKIYVSFLGKKPSQAQIKHLETYEFPGEHIELCGDYIYFYPENGAGRAKMGTNFFESKLKVEVTTRNIRTIDKMIALAE